MPDPEVAAKRLVEMDKEVSPVQDGWIYIELIMSRSCSAIAGPHRSTAPA